MFKVNGINSAFSHLISYLFPYSFKIDPNAPLPLFPTISAYRTGVSCCFLSFQN